MLFATCLKNLKSFFYGQNYRDEHMPKDDPQLRLKKSLKDAYPDLVDQVTLRSYSQDEWETLCTYTVCLSSGDKRQDDLQVNSQPFEAVQVQPLIVSLIVGYNSDQDEEGVEGVKGVKGERYDELYVLYKDVVYDVWTRTMCNENVGILKTLLLDLELEPTLKVFKKLLNALLDRDIGNVFDNRLGQAFC